MISKLYSINEAAPLLGIKPGTLRIWCQARKVPFLRIGRHPKFTEKQIEGMRRNALVEPIPRLSDLKKRRQG